jgi:hypothetical protein
MYMLNVYAASEKSGENEDQVKMCEETLQESE